MRSETPSMANAHIAPWKSVVDDKRRVRRCGPWRCIPAASCRFRPLLCASWSPGPAEVAGEEPSRAVALVIGYRVVPARVGVQCLLLRGKGVEQRDPGCAVEF